MCAALVHRLQARNTLNHPVLSPLCFPLYSLPRRSMLQLSSVTLCFQGSSPYSLVDCPAGTGGCTGEEAVDLPDGPAVSVAAGCSLLLCMVIRR